VCGWRVWVTPSSRVPRSRRTSIAATGRSTQKKSMRYSILWSCWSCI